MLKRTAKSCGPDASTPASSFAEASRPNRVFDKTISADDGDKRARSPGRARNKPLKPLRAGMPGESGGPVVTTLVCLNLPSAREAAGALATRHSPRPRFSGRTLHAPLGRTAPRDREAAACEKCGCLKREANVCKASCGGLRGLIRRC